MAIVHHVVAFYRLLITLTREIFAALSGLGSFLIEFVPVLFQSWSIRRFPP